MSVAMAPEPVLNLHPSLSWIVDRWLILGMPFGMAFSIFAVFAILPQTPVGIEGAFLGIMLAVWILFALYAVLWRRSYSFDLLADRVVLRHGVVSKKVELISYNTIKRISVQYGRQTGSTPSIVLYTVVPDYKNVMGEYKKLAGQPPGKAEEIAEIIKSHLAH